MLSNSVILYKQLFTVIHSTAR